MGKFSVSFTITYMHQSDAHFYKTVETTEHQQFLLLRIHHKQQFDSSIRRTQFSWTRNQE